MGRTASAPRKLRRGPSRRNDVGPGHQAPDPLPGTGGHVMRPAGADRSGSARAHRAPSRTVASPATTCGPAGRGRGAGHHRVPRARHPHALTATSPGWAVFAVHLTAVPAPGSERWNLVVVTGCAATTADFSPHPITSGACLVAGDLLAARRAASGWWSGLRGRQQPADSTMDRVASAALALRRWQEYGQAPARWRARTGSTLGKRGGPCPHILRPKLDR